MFERTWQSCQTFWHFPEEQKECPKSSAEKQLPQDLTRREKIEEGSRYILIPPTRSSSVSTSRRRLWCVFVCACVCMCVVGELLAPCRISLVYPHRLGRLELKWGQAVPIRVTQGLRARAESAVRCGKVPIVCPQVYALLSQKGFLGCFWKLSLVHLMQTVEPVCLRKHVETARLSSIQRVSLGLTPSNSSLHDSLFD